MRDELDWDEERVRQSVVGAAATLQASPKGEPAGGAITLSGPHKESDKEAQGTCLSLVFDCISGPWTPPHGEWWRPSEIQAAIRDFHGKLYSESSITARLRDLRKEKFGGHLIQCRRSWRRVKDPSGTVRRSREREYRVLR